MRNVIMYAFRLTIGKMIEMSFLHLIMEHLEERQSTAMNGLRAMEQEIIM